jgi:hypothetical protein
MNNCLTCGKDAQYTYCSLSCSNIDRTRKNEIKYNLNPLKCKNCNNPIPYYKRWSNNFCSSSCSASYNNIRKQRKQHYCATCGKVTYKNIPRCRECSIKNTTDVYGEKTLGSFTSTYARHKYQMIRVHAHRMMSDIEKECYICKYNKYVELCHIKPIASFLSESKLNEINAIENLVYLCPNHHWELDNGLTSIAE